jgi:hypothetical protein
MRVDQVAKHLPDGERVVREIYEEMLYEADHMTSGEKRNHRIWFGMAKEALGKMSSNTKPAYQEQ